MKKWSNSTKVTVGLVVLLLSWAVGRSLFYGHLAHVIAHEVATPAAVAATRKLVLQRKLARVFKDAPDQNKYQAIRTCQVLAADMTMVEIEGHHMPMAEAAAEATVEFLSDLELTVREVAADALGRMGKPAARPLLEIALNSPDKDVRSNGTKALAAIGLAVVPEMVEAVKTGKPTMKVGAATALGQLQTPRAVAALIGALSANEPEVRLACRDALVQLGKPSVGQLIEALGNATAFTRRHSAEALGELRDPAGAEPLLALFEDPHRLVRLAAIYAVGKIEEPVATEPLIGMLEDPDREIREASAVSLGQIGEQKAVPHLIAALQDEAERVQQRAAAALGRIGPDDLESLQAIADAASAERVTTRLAAVTSLGLIGDDRTVGPVARRVDPAQEPSEKVRRAAAEALGRLPSTDSIDALVRAFGDSDWRVNYAAQDALAALARLDLDQETGGPTAPNPLRAPTIARLLEVLGGEDMLPARYARMALAKITPPPLDELLSAVRSEDERGALFAALAVSDIGTGPALEALRALCEDADPGVARVASRALAAHGGQVALQPTPEAAPSDSAPEGGEGAGESAPAGDTPGA